MSNLKRNLLLELSDGSGKLKLVVMSLMQDDDVIRQNYIRWCAIQCIVQLLELVRFTPFTNTLSSVNLNDSDCCRQLFGPILIWNSKH